MEKNLLRRKIKYNNNINIILAQTPEIEQGLGRFTMNEISAAEILRMLRKAFGNSTMSQKMFISGTKTSKRVENVLMTWSAPEDHRRQQMTNNVDKLKELVLKNRRFTLLI